MDDFVAATLELFAVGTTVMAAVVLLERLHPVLAPLLLGFETVMGVVVFLRLLQPVLEPLPFLGTIATDQVKSDAHLVGRLLMGQARSRHRNFVVRTSDDSSLSSLEFESLFVPRSRLLSLHPPLMGCAHGVDAMNSCGVMHDARVNSLGTSLHSARKNSENVRIRVVVLLLTRVEQSH